MSTYADRVASELRAEMARHRISGSHVARQIGKPQTTVSRWMTGATEISLNDLVDVAEVIGISPAALLDRAYDLHRGGAGPSTVTTRYPDNSGVTWAKTDAYGSVTTSAAS